MKRSEIDLSDAVYQQLLEIGTKTRRTKTEVVRLGLSLVYLTVRAAEDGNKVLVCKPDGEPLREVKTGM